MRRLVATIIMTLACAANAAADMTPEEKNYHALHGLFHMYAVGSVCSYNHWAFSKQDTDEMLGKIKTLSKDVPPKTTEVMWSETRAIMEEGQEKTTAESCAQVHGQYVKGRPFIFGTQQPEPGEKPR